jgi:hypothetical protein
MTTQTNGHRELTQPQIDALWHNQTQNGIALSRAALAEAKTRLIPHAVPCRNCHQHNGHVVAGGTVEETG